MIRPICYEHKNKECPPLCPIMIDECDEAFELVVKIRMALKEHSVPACPLSRAVIKLLTDNHVGVEYEEI